MRVVIVGAGPTGLYLAIRLHKIGVKDIFVYDPRAGEYTRPGHLNSVPFLRAQQGINAPLKIESKLPIKDLERQLYAHAKSIGICIEKKKFIRLHAGENPGVVVAENNTEEYISCDYIFDCTGSRREVVQAINNISEQKLFALSPISETIDVKRHFLANVLMNDEHFKLLPSIDDNFSFQLRGESPLEFARNMERLRVFGWREFAYPYCHSIVSEKESKEKVCLYLESPNYLSTNLEEAWVQTVLEINTNNAPITFKQLPQPRKYSKKPRFLSFVVDPQELNTPFYQAAGFPTVIAQGDAEIEPHFHLGHGIGDTFERVDLLINSMKISEGVITDLNDEKYIADIANALNQHREQIIQYCYKRHNYFIHWLVEAQAHYEAAIATSDVQIEKLIFTQTLKEINARLAYQNGLALLQKLRLMNIESTFTQRFDALKKCHSLLAEAITNLPAGFNKERQHAIKELTNCAFVEKEIAKQYFKKGQFSLAKKSYKQILAIFESLPSRHSYRAEILTINSNIILTYCRSSRETDAIALAELVLNTYQEPSLRKTREKILFNVIKGIVDAIIKMSALIEYDKARMLILDKINAFCTKYQSDINPITVNLTKELALILRLG